jgi:hypothetical protein
MEFRKSATGKNSGFPVPLFEKEGRGEICFGRRAISILHRSLSGERNLSCRA